MKIAEKTLIDLAMSSFSSLSATAEEKIKKMHLPTCECRKKTTGKCTCPPDTAEAIDKSFEFYVFDKMFTGLKLIERSMGSRPMTRTRCKK